MYCAFCSACPKTLPYYQSYNVPNTDCRNAEMYVRGWVEFEGALLCDQCKGPTIRDIQARRAYEPGRLLLVALAEAVFLVCAVQEAEERALRRARNPDQVP